MPKPKIQKRKVNENQKPNKILHLREFGGGGGSNANNIRQNHVNYLPLIGMKRMSERAYKFKHARTQNIN